VFACGAAYANVAANVLNERIDSTDSNKVSRELLLFDICIFGLNATGFLYKAYELKRPFGSNSYLSYFP